MKNKHNIAMRCNKEQFEAIKPKLEKAGRKVSYHTCFKTSPYLANNFCETGEICNTSKANCFPYEYIEQWSEKVFLDACGIETTPTIQEVKEYFKDAEIVECLYSGKNENISKDITETFNYCSCSYFIRTEKSLNGDGSVELWNPDKGYAKIITKKSPEYTITREQILELSKESSFTNATLNKWFPEVFETVFNTGYYKHKNGENPKWFSYANFETKEYYGSGVLGDWFQGNAEYHLKYINSNCEPMSAEEVTEALKNEAVRRYKSGDYIERKEDFYSGELNNMIFEGVDFNIDSDGSFTSRSSNGFWIRLMDKSGNWATIIPTKTKEEAEKLLNCKIV